MSILKEAILESKKLKEDATEMAKQVILEEYREKLDSLAKELFSKKLNEEKEEQKDVDTRIDADEFKDFLASEVGKDKPLEIEISIDTNNDGEEDKVKTIDLTDEKDDKKIEEEFSNLKEEDEIMVIKEKEDFKEVELETSDKENIKKDMETAKELSEMEQLDEELKALETELKEDVTSEIAGEAPTDNLETTPTEDADDDDIDDIYNNMSEEEKKALLEELSDEEMEELAEAILSSFGDETETTIETPADNIDPNAVQTGNDQSIVAGLEDQAPVEEGMGVGVSHANAKKQGDSYGSYGKDEHSRYLAEKVKTIEETFNKLSQVAKKLEEENKTLKSQITTLNESETKLKELNSQYAEKVSAYKDKLYEAALVAKKTFSVNKLLLENSTTKAEKQSILESFTNVSTREEIDLVYKQLNEGFSKGVGVNILKESVDLQTLTNHTSNVLKTGSAKLVENTTHLNPMLKKMHENIQHMESKSKQK